MHKLESFFNENDYLLLDGAMGTMLFSLGLENGAAPEAWNLHYPERIQEVHRQYIASGSQVILTNTFGGTRYRLQLHDLQDRVKELNQAAATLARAVADDPDRDRPVIVAGSIGPTGELLAPMGTMTTEEAIAAFAAQAEGLLAGGVDVLWVETMSDLNEVDAAITGIRRVSTSVPIVATMSFDTNGRTMMGVTAAQAAQELGQRGLFAIGANCGNNLADTEAAVLAMHQAQPHLRLVSKANAGIPRWEGANLVYDGTPEVMAEHARRARAAGARLIGACCGSTGTHLRAMQDALAKPLTLAEIQTAEAKVEAPVNGNSATQRTRQRRRTRSGDG